ncbi:hypothetical protein RSAG8_07056, partial [Rhizoctonia solani AG-8 WAC10335]
MDPRIKHGKTGHNVRIMQVWNRKTGQYMQIVQSKHANTTVTKSGNYPRYQRQVAAQFCKRSSRILQAEEQTRPQAVSNLGRWMASKVGGGFRTTNTPWLVSSAI